MEFIWHDGGRAACGFVGVTGDCVVRALAIATGDVYRDVYDSIGHLAHASARHGVADAVIHQFLHSHGWQKTTCQASVPPSELPAGVVLVHFRSTGRKRNGHLSCLIDHTVYDTWNPWEDSSFEVASYWTLAAHDSDSASDLPARAPGRRPVSDRATLTQNEYDRILKRVRALHRTASNEASTEGEVRNALRAMQALMLAHNLNRSDILEEDNTSHLGMTKRACPLNGVRTCRWETSLAFYLTKEVFPTVQFYSDRRGHRSLFWFYGPVDDVDQTIGLFQEMLLTIATAARLKYGGHSRGSGASYAEGYVAGLPRSQRPHKNDGQTPISQHALVHARSLAVQSAALEWLDVECGIRLVTSRASSGRYHFDWRAHRDGTVDGARHEPSTQHKQKRLPHHPG